MVGRLAADCHPNHVTNVTVTVGASAVKLCNGCAKHYRCGLRGGNTPSVIRVQAFFTEFARQAAAAKEAVRWVISAAKSSTSNRPQSRWGAAAVTSCGTCPVRAHFGCPVVTQMFCSYYSTIRPARTKQTSCSPLPPGLSPQSDSSRFGCTF